MPRPRNFLPLAGFLICLIAFFSYFFVFYRFPVTRDVPWVNWLLFAAGLGLLAAGLRRAFGRREVYRGRVMGPVLGVLSLGVLAFFLYMTLVVSRELPVSANAPKVGEKAPDFTLPDAQGRPVRLAEALGPAGAPGAGSGNWVLLIFYRGTW